MSAPERWAEVVQRVQQNVSPEWVRQAQEHGGQAWIRLILLVDAHHQLASPRVVEKVAMTMADLAVGQGREPERDGWEAVRERAADERMELVAWLVDAAPGLLSDELLPLFARSIEPSPPGM
jgi:hypothetical protein